MISKVFHQSSIRSRTENRELNPQMITMILVMFYSQTQSTGSKLGHLRINSESQAACNSPVVALVDNEDVEIQVQKTPDEGIL